jgi:hypothetical protein
MKLTVSELGGIFLLLFGVFHFLHIFIKTRSVLVILGIVTVGSAGFVGRMLTDTGSWAQHAFSSVLGWAIGVPVAAGLFIVLVILLVHALFPKNGAPKHTGWIALAVGVLIVAGVAGIPALGGLRGGIDSVMSSIVSTVNSA